MKRTVKEHPVVLKHLLQIANRRKASYGKCYFRFVEVRRYTSFVVTIRRSITEPHSFPANELPLLPASLLRVTVTGVTLSSTLYWVSSFREATIATAEYFWLPTARWSPSTARATPLPFVSIHGVKWWYCAHVTREDEGYDVSCLHVRGELECSWSRGWCMRYIIYRGIIYN